MIQSTGVGLVVTLIGTPHDEREGDTLLSTRTREAILSAIVTDTSAAPDASETPAAHASALRASLGDSTAHLTPGEALLLDELLGTISAAG